jgi:hypothetical protein
VRVGFAQKKQKRQRYNLSERRTKGKSHGRDEILLPRIRVLVRGGRPTRFRYLCRRSRWLRTRFYSPTTSCRSRCGDPIFCTRSADSDSGALYPQLPLVRSKFEGVLPEDSEGNRTIRSQAGLNYHGPIRVRPDGKIHLSRINISQEVGPPSESTFPR